MYRYDEFDHQFVRERVEQFRDQVERRLKGDLTEDQFKPLRLQNGLYLQLHAYMLRVAIPYGTLSSRQMHKLADLSAKYDKGYGHFTTRQNIQYNWISLADTPAILEELAEVEMHAIQTSGNCIRNVTADHLAGASADEIEDPRPYAELIRQWSTLHPEFAFLPRKFKIAVVGSEKDRAAIRFHDIGLCLVKNDVGEVGFQVHVGGGMGRSPFVAHQIRDFLPKEDLLAYVEAILRVYNQFGRRDNKYKARVKILVHEAGLDEIRAAVEAEYGHLQGGRLTIPRAEQDRILAYFQDPEFETLSDTDIAYERALQENPDFARWVKNNTHPHKKPGYVSATIALKSTGEAPGDADTHQLHVLADLGERYSFDELRVSHEQNVILPHVRKIDLIEIWATLVDAGMGAPVSGLITDIIACPGLDYCALANARSIPVAQEISQRFANIEAQQNIGPLKLKISGCINACGHHHVGHIGILGVDRKNEELYQITLGGSGEEDASIGTIIGPGFPADKITDAVETTVGTYLDIRQDENETFLQTYRRVGATPFKERLYGTA